MKSKFSSLIRVAVITLVVTLMASVMTAAYAGGDCDDVRGTWYGGLGNQFTDPHISTMQITKLKHGEKKIMIQLDTFNEIFQSGPAQSDHLGEFHGDAEKVEDNVWQFTLKAHAIKDQFGAAPGFVVITGVIIKTECDELSVEGCACVYANIDALHSGSPEVCSPFSGPFHRWQQQQQSCGGM